MKKIVILASALIAAVSFLSCEKQEAAPAPVKLVPVTFEASTDQVRAGLDGLNVSWTAGDVIYVGPMATVSSGSVVIGTEGTAGVNVYELTAASSGTRVSFTGYLPESLTSTGYALYGTPNLYQIYYKSLRISPRWSSADTQTGVKDGVAAGTLMMYAFTNGDDCADIDFGGREIHFHLGSALLKVGVVGSDIKKITLSTSAAVSTSANFLGGLHMNYNIRTGGYSLVDTTGAIQSIDLVPDGLSAFVPGNYYFTLPAPNGSTGSIAGLKISYTKSDDSVVSVTSENTLTPTAGKIYNSHVDDTLCSPE